MMTVRIGLGDLAITREMVMEGWLRVLRILYRVDARSFNRSLWHLCWFYSVI